MSASLSTFSSSSTGWGTLWLLVFFSLMPCCRVQQSESSPVELLHKPWQKKKQQRLKQAAWGERSSVSRPDYTSQATWHNPNICIYRFSEALLVSPCAPSLNPPHTFPLSFLHAASPGHLISCDWICLERGSSLIPLESAAPLYLATNTCLYNKAQPVTNIAELSLLLVRILGCILCTYTRLICLF